MMVVYSELLRMKAVGDYFLLLHVEAVVDTGDDDVCIDGNFLALGDLMDIEELDKFDFQILRW